MRSTFFKSIPLNLGVLIGWFLLFKIDEAWGRAGGARATSGHADASPVFYISVAQAVLAVSGLSYSLYIFLKIRTQTRATKKIIEKYAAADPAWNLEHLRQIVRGSFLKVQRAWTERNQEICRGCVTDRIYMDHKKQTDDLVEKSRINILDEMSLHEILIVQANHITGTIESDKFCAFISGKMIDYEWDEVTKKITDGDKEAKKFKELWLFVRHGNEWLLDEIHSKVNRSELDTIRRRLT